MISRDFQAEVWNKLNSIERRLSFAGGGGSYAPAAAQYVVMAVSALLPNERRLQAAEGIALADGGAGGDADLTLDINGLVEDAAIASGDFLVYYDTPAGDHKKLDLDDLEIAIGGAVDHGALIGLGDDDHAIYLLADGTRDLGGTWNAYADIRTDRWLNQDSNTFLGMGVAGAGNLAHGAGNEGYFNTALGGQSAQDITTGEYNVSMGYRSLFGLTTGTKNTALGAFALGVLAAGAKNTAIGYAALYTNTANNSVAVGYGALYANTTGIENTSIGFESLKTNSTGAGNTAAGFQALALNTGAENVAIGAYALSSNTTANYNVAIGYEALIASTGAFNTAVGRTAAFTNTTGSENTALGTSSLYTNTTGAKNTALGRKALVLSTTASENVAVGYSALGAITDGPGNIGIGYQAGDNLTTADYCIIIGYDLNAISATANYQVNIGGIYRGHIDDGEVYLACPAAIAADADLQNSEVTFAVDEVNDELDIKVKYSGGGVKSGVVALA